MTDTWNGLPVRRSANGVWELIPPEPLNAPEFNELVERQRAADWRPRSNPENSYLAQRGFRKLRNQQQ